MISKILSWLSGGAINAIGKQLIHAYEIKVSAQNDQQRIEADMRIAELSAQQAVLIAEQGNWLTRWIRPAFALPFVIYINKVIVWDMVLGWGTTPPLSIQMAQLLTVIAGAYFFTRPLEKWIKKR
jgi:hypothetical protein